MAKAMKTKSAKGAKRLKQRPMPADPKDLARAMFSQADKKMFGGKKTRKQPEKEGIRPFTSTPPASSHYLITTAKEE